MKRFMIIALEMQTIIRIMTNVDKNESMQKSQRKKKDIKYLLRLEPDFQVLEVE